MVTMLHRLGLASVALCITLSGVVGWSNTVPTSQPVSGPVLYEISTRPWLYALSQELGRPIMLKDVPDSEWTKLKDIGIEVVWLMGVWSLGPYGLHHDRTDPSLLKTYAEVLPGYTMADIIGSPYAITNYTVNPEIGTKADLAATRAKLNSLGIKLMLDMVPNHSAVDANWSTSDPEYYVQKPKTGTWNPANWIEWNGHDYAYGRDPYDGAWTDTIQYNYWNPPTVAAMTNVLMTVAENADMVRCDMAMLMLNDVIERTWGTIMQANGFTRPSQEFWALAIQKVKGAFPDFEMMAEAYNYGITNPPEKQFLQNLGFDYTYDKTPLDLLKTDNLDNLRSYISSQSQGFFDKTAHFVENHDEPRAAAVLGGDAQAYAGSVIISTIPGLRLYYFGQFKGFKNKLDVHLRRALPEPTNTTVEALYDRLISVVHNSTVFHTGEWTYIDMSLDGSGWRLCAWRWAPQGGGPYLSKRVVVVNFSDTGAWNHVVLPDAEGPNGSDSMVVKELLSGVQYTRSASTLRSTGLVVGVAPWSAQIFEY